MSMSTFNLILKVFCLFLLSNIFIFTALQFHHAVPKLDLLLFTLFCILILGTFIGTIS